MELKGRLSEFPLRELLDVCVQTMISGMVEVETPDGATLLFFRRGELQHAHGPHATGDAAVWPLFLLEDAAYCFRGEGVSAIQTITDSAVPLIARAAAKAEQWRAVEHLIPHTRIVPVRALPVSMEQIQIHEEDWPVLASLDDQRTVAEVALVTSLDEVAVAHSLVRLHAAGLVVFSTTPRAPESPPQAPPASPTASPTAHLFAQLLTRLPLPASAPEPAVDPFASTDELVRLLRAA